MWSLSVSFSRQGKNGWVVVPLSLSPSIVSVRVGWVGPSLWPSTVKVRAAGWWSLRLLHSLRYGWRGGGLSICFLLPSR